MARGKPPSEGGAPTGGSARGACTLADPLDGPLAARATLSRRRLPPPPRAVDAGKPSEEEAAGAEDSVAAMRACTLHRRNASIRSLTEASGQTAGLRSSAGHLRFGMPHATRDDGKLPGAEPPPSADNVPLDRATCKERLHDLHLISYDLSIASAVLEVLHCTH